jgi:hypothetical protein
MSFMPGGDSAVIPAGAIAAQHNCGLWDAVSRTASRAR